MDHLIAELVFRAHEAIIKDERFLRVLTRNQSDTATISWWIIQSHLSFSV